MLGDITLTSGISGREANLTRPKPEIRMSKLEEMTNDQMTNYCSCRFFAMPASCFFRRSTFVLRHFLQVVDVI
ncbi:MAG: hypothetical protein DMF24_13110 [Verrucomicrobia bacterium]|nr:MAG: hypothetical protein DMF24_13110 [Verrucomicrobiota bacterium]